MTVSLIDSQAPGLGPAGRRAIPPAESFLASRLFLLALGAGVLVLERLRVRIDERGLARRRLLGWEVWPWSAFASGQVEPSEDFLHHLHWRRPDGKLRTLGIEIELLDPSERELLKHMLQGRLNPPRPPEPPGSTRVRFADRTRGLRRLDREASFGPEGIRLAHRDLGRWHPRAAVQRPEITRLTHDRRGFRRLELDLDDGSEVRLIESRNAQDRRPNWSGAEAASIVGVLRRHVRPDRVRIVAESGPPGDRREAEARRERAGRRLSDLGPTTARIRKMWNLMILLYAGILFLLCYFEMIVGGLRLGRWFPPGRGAGLVGLFAPVLVWRGGLSALEFAASATRRGLESERDRMIVGARAAARAAV